MIFKNNKVYDILKYMALVVFDAIGIAYKGLAEIWDLPYGNEIMMTCSILAIFVGTLIGISSHKYNKTELLDEYYQEEENAMAMETNEEGEE